MRAGKQVTGRQPPQRSTFRHRAARRDRIGPEDGISAVLSGSVHESVDPEFDAIDLADVLRSLAVVGEVAETDDPC